MEQPSFGFAEEVARGHHVLGGRAELAGARRAPPRLPDEVWVRGEVQNLSRSRQRPHLLLAGREGRPGRPGPGPSRRARSSATTARRSPGRWPRCPAPSSATTSRCASAAGYACTRPPGSYQLVMTGIDPVFTVGGIAANRERVLRVLAAEGLLERQRARSSWRRCRCGSGLITSAGSAAYHDFVARAEAQRRTRGRSAWSTSRCRARPRRGASSGRSASSSQLDVDVGRARPRRRLPRRPRAVRHRAGGAGDRGDAGAGVHRRRARDRPQRRRRGRAHRVQDPHRVRAAARAPGRRVRRPGSTTRRSGSRRGRGSGWRSPARELDDAGAPGAAERAGGGRARARPRSTARTVALDELARRRTVELGAQLDGCARRVAELGRRATRDRTRVLDDARARARHARAAPPASGRRCGSTSQRGRRARARSRAACSSAATRSPATATAAWCAQRRRVARRRARRDRARDRPRHQPGRDASTEDTR